MRMSVVPVSSTFVSMSLVGKSDDLGPVEQSLCEMEHSSIQRRPIWKSGLWSMSFQKIEVS